jgi:hypothetical protein
VLYRGFEHLEHARSFVDEGIIRLGEIEAYRMHEDERRRDSHEGTAELRTPDADSQEIILGRAWTYNKVYVLCCSAADPEYVASKFGRNLVRINRPGALIADIRDHVSSHPAVPNPRVDPRWSGTILVQRNRDHWTLMNGSRFLTPRSQRASRRSKNIESPLLATFRTSWCATGLQQHPRSSSG